MIPKKLHYILSIAQKIRNRNPHKTLEASSSFPLLTVESLPVTTTHRRHPHLYSPSPPIRPNLCQTRFSKLSSFRLFSPSISPLTLATTLRQSIPPLSLGLTKSETSISQFETESHFPPCSCRPSPLFHLPPLLVLPFRSLSLPRVSTSSSTSFHLPLRVMLRFFCAQAGRLPLLLLCIMLLRFSPLRDVADSAFSS
ncbi:hypothetical protein PIB30_052517, partial [Stylosanthes scabra]|nr:hypothetical protein [Stylosanthes scabra]